MLDNDRRRVSFLFEIIFGFQLVFALFCICGNQVNRGRSLGRNLLLGETEEWRDAARWPHLVWDFFPKES